jgi:putative FmdB family regulatory protein
VSLDRDFTARNLSLRRIPLERLIMPAYSYRCEQCGKRFTRVEPISAHSERTPPCPKCRSKRVRRVFGSFFAKTSRKS